MPAAAVQGAEKVIEAGGKAYQHALRKYPIRLVQGGLFVTGLFGSAVTLQTLGYLHIHNILDAELPTCRKVQLFVTSKDFEGGFHKRVPGIKTLSDLDEVLASSKTVRPVLKKGTKFNWSIPGKSDFILNSDTPVWTLCKPWDARYTDQLNPPCSVELNANKA